MRKLGLMWVLACVAATLVGSPALAAIVSLSIGGTVTDVQDSPFAGGQMTNGVLIGDPVDADLMYDDATAQARLGTHPPRVFARAPLSGEAPRPRPEGPRRARP